MNENGQSEEVNQEERDDTPLGALFVTGSLAIIILVLWFSMYILNIFRS